VIGRLNDRKVNRCAKQQPDREDDRTREGGD
jgi:hypothetical protein